MKLWIARDLEGFLKLFTTKPYESRGRFVTECDVNNFAYLYESSFPEVTFKNSPQQVEIKLIKEE